jgi:predicted phosphodiesterase
VKTLPTHGLVRPEVAKAFAGVQLILHVGDVGGSTVLARLATIAPVEAVYGNVDDPHDPALRAERVVTPAAARVEISRPVCV